jgi:hypothetical protein
MGLRVSQVLARVVRPALAAMPSIPNGVHVEQILLMIAAHESGGFVDLYQRPNGPAVGLWQMEPVTFDDLLSRVAPRVPGSLAFATSARPSVDECAWNLRLAAAFARLKLYASPGALPDRDETWEQARYAKRYYNSALGKAKVEDYVDAYERHVARLSLWPSDDY